MVVILTRFMVRSELARQHWTHAAAQRLRKPMIRTAACIVGLAVAGALTSCGDSHAPASDAAALSFEINEGRNINSFVRQGAVAAHLLLRSGSDPRVLVAFPAGNSGVGLWFEKTEKPVTWTLTGTPKSVTADDPKGRALRGIEAVVTVDATALSFKQAVLSSVRVLRDYQALGTIPAEVSASPTVAGNRITWTRARLDGAPGYRLSIEALDDATVSTEAIQAANDGRLHLKVVALTGETPLTPLDGTTLLSSAAANDERARNVLTFLSYRDKYLAGSWRFDTYFGRDTLMSLTLLSPVLQPLALESGIASVLARLAPNGEVAHEEDIGEFAVLRNAKEGRGRTDTPIYDYGMVDDDFMLAPVAANWLLSASGHARASAFLASKNAGGERHGDALVRNFLWVVTRTAQFAAAPQATNLVSIKDGRRTGQWRDSEEGLGRGRYAYDVNAVFVPAALEAIDRLLKSALLDSYLTTTHRETLAQAAAQRSVWSTKAPPLFLMTVPAEQARASIETYAADVGVNASAALASLKEGPLVFNALSLDAAGAPVPVMHSDDGFALLFGMPTAQQLERSITALMRPFPAGDESNAAQLWSTVFLAFKQTEWPGLATP
jgi:hypothetical protein